MRALTDKVVVITGASQGIGAAIARHFATEKCLVVICGRNRERLQKVGESLGLPRKNWHPVTSDITKSAGMKKIVDSAVKKFGRIDIFVNNAGVGVKKPIVDLTEAEYDTIMATNLRAVFISFKLLIPLMRKQKEGQIINISSGAARIGLAEMASYSASKAALNALSEGVAGEVRNEGIKINVLAPGSTDTDFRSNMSGDQGHISSSKKKLTVDEVAEAVLFLAKQNRNAWTSMADLRPLIVK